MPKRYANPSEVDGPVIVKYYGAKGGKGFFLAKNREVLEGFQPTGPHVIQQYVLGTRYYIHFFYSPLSDTGYPGRLRVARAPRDGPAATRRISMSCTSSAATRSSCARESDRRSS